MNKDPEKGSWIIFSRSHHWKVLDPLGLSYFKALQSAFNLDSGFYTNCFVL